MCTLACRHMHQCESKGVLHPPPLHCPPSSCPPPPPTPPLLSFTNPPPFLPAVIASPSPLSHPFPSSSHLPLSPLPLRLSSLCASECVLWAASQDDGEVRAALGTSSQWRGLRPRDALAAISQGSPAISCPDGLQVTHGKRRDRLKIVLKANTPNLKRNHGKLENAEVSLYENNVSRKGAKGLKESNSIVGSCLYPQWVVLANIYIVMFVQLWTPTLHLPSASQTVIKGIWGVGVSMHLWAASKWLILFLLSNFVNSRWSWSASYWFLNMLSGAGWRHFCTFKR